MMARYYFNLHECGTVTSDPEGREFASLAAARDAAKEDARAIMCEELGTGCLCLSCRIEITDGEGRCLDLVLFKDAVDVVGA
ncbi:DUF6894 family protein [Sphingomonas qilianensis]|uniref:DUF6894 domain-containing protein n=1 Tax=Sphingomonas qilianensis TaxID=1736690 RepID=A0ABU9XM28_9SPHN